MNKDTLNLIDELAAALVIVLAVIAIAVGIDWLVLGCIGFLAFGQLTRLMLAVKAVRK